MAVIKRFPVITEKQGIETGRYFLYS